MFKLDQKVVCVEENFEPSMRADNEMGIFNTYPKKDKVYSVRGFDKDGGGIYLNEIKNFPALYSNGFGERSFSASKFIPLEDNIIAEKLVAELIESSKISNTIYN